MKPCAKFLADALATLVVLPALALYLALRLAFGTGRTFPGFSQAFGLIPGMCGAYFRRAFYRFVLARCAAGSWIGFGTVFSHATASVGRYAYTGVYCCLGDVTLEDDVLLGSHVSIMNGAGQHGIERLDIPIREQPGIWPRITIGKDTWIGDRAIVMADVGAHCVIGAGSVVTRPIPDYAIAVGVPAKVIRYREGAPVGDGGLTGQNPKCESRNSKQTRNPRSETAREDAASEHGVSDFGFVSNFDIRDSGLGSPTAV